MPNLPVTSVAAAVLSLIYVTMSVRVIQARISTGTSMGDGSGGVPAGLEHTIPLLVRARSHANFAEYVPLGLIVLGLAELQGTRRWVIAVLAAMLVGGRLLHPIGMGRKVPNPYRLLGMVLTFGELAGASVAILVNTLVA
jgi:uncharacterized membrane protein YecN with MAPEG domain